MIPRRLALVSALALSLALGLAFARPAPLDSHDTSTSQHEKAPAQAADGSYEIDPVHSSVLFKVKHMNAAWFFGRFAEYSGKIALNGAAPEKSSVELEIPLKGLDTFNKDRDAHVLGTDFFDAAQFPKVTFKSTKVAKSAKGFAVTGDLTLHGVTKPVSFDVEATGAISDPRAGNVAGFYAEIHFKRSDYGLKSFLDALSDDITVIASLEAKR